MDEFKDMVCSPLEAWSALKVVELASLRGWTPRWLGLSGRSQGYNLLTRWQDAFKGTNDISYPTAIVIIRCEDIISTNVQVKL